MKYSPSVFGARLKQLRLKRGLTQEAVRVRVGIGCKSTVSEYENGKLQWPKTYARIREFAFALDCDARYLTGEINTPRAGNSK